MEMMRKRELIANKENKLRLRHADVIANKSSPLMPQEPFVEQLLGQYACVHAKSVANKRIRTFITLSCFVV